ncbi:hypothetical protein BDP27DRAFT_1363816 [Rhodocollybia butyracea]|uniref:Protein kinase domain-containing protein n=1 Tax=Rhodocollybia butyracea TaxID=206335 RepID=A0A9P5PT67_9AGAR|nr:hypothetical protein BDP27DRAFT_1363816 [Rhodocollybia butyracea]
MPDDVEGQNAMRILWEEWFYRLSMECYETERGAYANLSHLQGSVIPKFIGSGHLELPERAIDVPLIILEYIPDSVSLRDVPLSVVRAINTMASPQSIFNSVNHNRSPDTPLSVLKAANINVDAVAVEDDFSESSNVKTDVRASDAPFSVLKAVDTNVDPVAVEDDSPDPKVKTGVPWLDVFLEGVDSLVEHGVIHGDLQHRNVLLKSCPQQAVLIDFGCALLKQDAGDSWEVQCSQWDDNWLIRYWLKDKGFELAGID